MLHVRPVESDDLDSLAELDRAYSRACGEETMVEASSLSFYSRSGHSFVAESDHVARGFVLAQAVWGGGRPVVQVSRLVGSGEGAAGVREALVEALVKSAYDAGVYDLVVTLPERDAAGSEALELGGFVTRPLRVLGLTLGSRGGRPARRSRTAAEA